MIDADRKGDAVTLPADSNRIKFTFDKFNARRAMRGAEAASLVVGSV